MRKMKTTKWFMLFYTVLIKCSIQKLMKITKSKRYIWLHIWVIMEFGRSSIFGKFASKRFWIRNSMKLFIHQEHWLRNSNSNNNNNKTKVNYNRLQALCLDSLASLRVFGDIKKRNHNNQSQKCSSNRNNFNN